MSMIALLIVLLALTLNPQPVSPSADAATIAPLNGGAIAMGDALADTTYVVRIVDQYGDPVPEAAVGFCLDTGCIPVEADMDGIATFTGAPARYHLKVVDAPDGYDWPDDTDSFIGPASGEATLVITKE